MEKRLNAEDQRRRRQPGVIENQPFDFIDIRPRDRYLDRRSLLRPRRKNAGELRRGKLGQRARCRGHTSRHRDDETTQPHECSSITWGRHSRLPLPLAGGHQLPVRCLMRRRFRALVGPRSCLALFDP